MHKLFRLVSAFALVCFVAACSPKPPAQVFQAEDVTGANFASSFSLTDMHGQRRSLADYRGKAVAMFFGYTHCPDVCPTTLAEVAAAMKQLGDKADRVQVLFVSVDPVRDTNTVLRSYVAAFDPRFVGLSGTPDEIRAVARDYKVVYQKHGGTPGAADYTMDHSAGSYLYDPEGRLRVYVPYGKGAAVFAHDLGILLADSPH